VNERLPPSIGEGVTALVVAVRYLSPAVPVEPVSPVRPVGPVFPVGPSIPSRFTLYMAFEKVPLMFVIESIVRAPLDFV
jgi:hypothetical protein